MRGFARFIVLTSLGMSASPSLASESCDRPLLKTIPFNRTLTAQNVQISIFNDARFAYDCASLTADSRGGINLGFFKLNADILTVQATASHKDDQAELATRTLMLGYELGHEKKSISTGYRKTFEPVQDLDISDHMIIPVGPMPVKIRYGVEGSGKVQVTAGLKGTGVQVNLIPSAKVKAYVQAGADIQILSGSTRGDLHIIDGSLSNALALSYKSVNHQHGVHVTATSLADFRALEGAVKARAEIRGPKDVKTFENQLFAWEGQHLSGKILDFSEDISLNPSSREEAKSPSNETKATFTPPESHEITLDEEVALMNVRMDTWE